MKGRIKAIVALALAAMLVLGLVACGGGSGSGGGGGTAAAEGEYIILGNPQPLSGINAQVGRATTQAIELAVHHINENGGFNGVPLRLINYDDENSPEVAVRVAQRMLMEDNVDLIIGTLLSSNLMATGDMFEEAGILTIGNGNGPSFMEQGWDFMFRAGPNLGFAMPTVADMMLAEGWTRAAVIHGLDDATRSSAEAFMENAERVGIEVVAIETYIDGDAVFPGQIASMLGANPDVILISANGPTFPLITRELRLADYTGPIFNREAPPADAVEVAGDAIEGVIFVYPYITYEYPGQADDPVMVEFLEKFYDFHGEMPFHDCAYRAWDAMMAMWEASRIAGANDSESLRQAMHQVQIRGLGGYLDFTGGNGEGMPLFRAWTMSGGRPAPFGG